MIATLKPLYELCAADLMTRELTVLTTQMPLREAASLLIRSRSTGAPVIDGTGKCVGVLSASDFLRWALKDQNPTVPRPLSCSYQTDYHLSDGEPLKLCTLPFGACPVQSHVAVECNGLHVCRDPNSVLTDWQMVELEKLPADDVCHFMTADPVTAGPETSIRTLARMMIDTHVHRVIIVNEEQHPIGIVSSSDLLAQLAYHDESTL
jgi:CBS domain-containing protein